MKPLNVVDHFPECCRYNLTEPEDGKWGSTEDPVNPVFNGMIGQLQREVGNGVPVERAS